MGLLELKDLNLHVYNKLKSMDDKEATLGRQTLAFVDHYLKVFMFKMQHFVNSNRHIQINRIL